MSKINIDKNQLHKLYIDEGYTQKKCAEILGVHVWNVQAALKRYQIPTRDYTGSRASQLVIDMTDEMYEVLRGALLGDGSLTINKNATNARFNYASKSYQHVEYVTHWFKKYSNVGIRSYDRFDKRTNKYYRTNDFHTLCSQTFTQEYYKWYTDRIKHIPNDLILTPLMCKIWYLGDGCLANCSNNPDETSQKIYLCTNCFKKDEIEEILLPQLSEFHPYLSKTENDNQYRITIGEKKYISKFIEYLGDCPFDDYKYKWDVKPPKKGCCGRSIFCEDLNEWYYLFDCGLSSKKIGDIYGCTHGPIDYQLLKHNGYGYKRKAPDEYKTWETLYSDEQNISNIQDDYKRNAIRKYIEYMNSTL